MLPGATSAATVDTNSHSHGGPAIRATGRLAAISAERLVELRLRGAVMMADAVGFDELERAGGVVRVGL
ncbi:hypothetical protein [Microbacterium sp. LWO13-1.2]|uniref:hypothetical protein n=1 Tax=Microbacterium sp. LWO13-1.2 TaxID=3135262 RepID=UPI003139EAD6